MKNHVKSSLEDCKLPYVLCGGIIIPKGAKEFDQALVVDVLEWLKQFPTAQKPYIAALRQYYDNNEPRDIADNLRKSLEGFLQDYLTNKKNFDNNINEIGLSLKDAGVNEEIRNMVTTLSRYYNNLNNKTAKHHDKVEKTDVEFLLYQTGVFMRYLCIVKQK